MRQRERIFRVVAEIAEKSGLDPRSNDAINTILPHIDKKDFPLDILAKKKSEQEVKEELVHQEEVAKDPPVKKKNPFPPKKKKSSETTEEKNSVIDE